MSSASVVYHENAEHSRYAPEGRAGTGQARPRRVRAAQTPIPNAEKLDRNWMPQWPSTSVAIQKVSKLR